MGGSVRKNTDTPTEDKGPQNIIAIYKIEKAHWYVESKKRFVKAKNLTGKKANCLEKHGSYPVNKIFSKIRNISRSDFSRSKPHSQLFLECYQ